MQHGIICIVQEHTQKYTESLLHISSIKLRVRQAFSYLLTCTFLALAAYEVNGVHLHSI